jgi:hypothetical protein
MHIDPLHEVIALDDEALKVAREAHRIESIDRDEDFNGPHRVRFQVIDAIILDRRINGGN